MSQAVMASAKFGGLVVLTILLLFASAGSPAKADPCAEACRSQHNACRMAAKLLFPARCDAQLQGCISHCFAAGRFNRGMREGREPRDFRDRRGPPDMRGPPGIEGPPVGRGPPEMRGPPGVEGPPVGRGPPEMREPPAGGGGPGREFRGFRDERGPRWLGGPRGWRGRF